MLAIRPILGAHSLGIVLKVLWVQQTLHLLTAEKRKSYKIGVSPNKCTNVLASDESTSSSKGVYGN